MPAVIEFFTKLFNTDGFPPRWDCGTGWTTGHGVLHIASDVAIFGAYFGIPISIAFFLRKRRDVPFPLIGWLFGAFILSCGLTHLVESILFYFPVYRFSGLMKVITAIVSWATLVAVWRIMPNALRLPGIHALNLQLESALSLVEERGRQLSAANKALEQRTAELTLRNFRLATAFRSARTFTVRWIESGEVAWTIGVEDALEGTLDFREAFSRWNQLLAPEQIDELQNAALHASRTGAAFTVNLPIQGVDPEVLKIRIIARPEPEVRGQPRSFVGMGRLVDPRGAGEQ